MKIIKNIKIMAMAALSLLSLAGCKDRFIDLYPLDEANVANSFRSPEDANLALLGVYDALQTGYPQQMAQLTELVTDNVMVQPSRIGDAGNANLRELEFFQLTDFNGVVSSRYNGLYNAISRANLLLDKINTIPFLDENLKNQYIGEARFLRALFYFDLVRFFGGVPITLTEVKTAEEAFSFSRASQEDVYQLIVSELTEAAPLLPISYPNATVGRVTRGAAVGLLAKVHLTQGQPALALPLLRQLRAAPYTYRLLPTYAAVFATDNTAESLFEIQFSDVLPGEGNPYPNYNLPNDGTAGRDIFGPGFLGGGSSGFNLPTRDMWNAFAPADQRRPVSLARYFSTQEGDTIFYITKYRGAPTRPNDSEGNIPVLRFADVLLMQAEAVNESNQGPTAEAYDAVDQVRRRAGLPALPRTLDYETFRRQLLEERRVELAFENHRWFDLKRFGLAQEILSAKGYAIQPHHLLYPIPRVQVEINREKMEQNPGYN